jgi:peptide/nickel transport system substrate-binding protein
MGGITASDIASLDRPYDISAWPTASYYAVFINQSQSIPLEDNFVREALSEAVDRNALVQTVLGGYGTPEYGPIPRDAAYYIPTNVTTSLAVASATLTADGWLPGANGFRAKSIQKTTVPLVINLTVPQIDFLQTTADALQTAWQSIGVQVNIAMGDPQNLLNDTIKNRDYESLLFGNILGPSSDLYAFWDSSQRFSPGLNLSIYSNPNTDALVEAARTDMNDASRTAQFADAENNIAADNPAIFLYSPDYLYVTDKSVQGVTPQLLIDPSDRFRDISAWYLNTARVLK